MLVNFTQRASIVLDQAEGELKEVLTRVINSFEHNIELPPEVEVKNSIARPGVFVAKVMDYRLFYRREESVILVLDIVPRSEAYQ